MIIYFNSFETSTEKIKSLQLLTKIKFVSALQIANQRET